MVCATAADAPPRELAEERSRPDDLARLAALRETYDRNLTWYQSNAAGLAARYPGWYVCVAGGEAFAAADPTAAVAAARTAHPGDWGAVVTVYVSPDPGPKFHAG